MSDLDHEHSASAEPPGSPIIRTVSAAGRLAEWKKCLTAAFRDHFELVGEDFVRTDVSRHAYQQPEKHMAALAWLHGKQQQRQRTERIRFWWMLAFTFIAAAGAAIAAWPVLFGS